MGDEVSELEREVRRLRRRLTRSNEALRASEDIAEDATRRLHAKVAELTLLNELAAQARSEADEQRETMQRFIAIISHEIRTPLNTVIGLAHLASQLDLPSPGSRYVEDIHAAGHHLLELVNRVLDFSVLRAGKMSLEPSLFKFDAVVERLRSMLEGRLVNKPVELVFDIAEDVPSFLLGDPVRLRQVLLNFLYNAVKFTEEGSIELSVRVADWTGSRLVLGFAVRDTGVGIPEHVLDRLFHDYEQGGAWVPRADGGTGLGLAINREIVRLMDGEIEVESVVGAGSVFRFTAAFEMGDGPLLDLEMVEGRGMNVHLLGATALLVDDNPSARRAVGAMLRSFGMEVEVAESAADAEALMKKAHARQRRFDFAVIDQQMSDADGEHVSRALRAIELPHHSCRHVLLMSGYGKGAPATGLTGIDGAVAKPVTPSKLYDVLVRLVLPQREGSLSPPSSASASGSASEHISAEERRALGGRRILVVDDSVMNVLVARGLLEAVGCQVDSVSNGADAICAASRTRYDAIIMDMNMPVMGGLEATQRIHQDTMNQLTPVIGCTANTLPEDLAACRAVGMVAVIAKPFSPDALYRLILNA